ncbi:DoxX-like family protein [Algoriphagus faecimaris]|uniref:DoxX-like family protein n=1 Tax=Algoriphagus faecimaris TaxID=686796 RepID=A0A1G6Y109_9BACT|nr:MauE/DoxX family redox-associated membrane protein [Algoriphagus faecimaris]SDD83961.1 DoxX-like family protein [Algoriphagus faecimaris]
MRWLKLIPSIFLILVWVYTGLEKFFRFESSRKAFLNQPMPNDLEEVLAIGVPALELLLALLLLFQVSRWWGYLGSLLLLSVFTTYVGLIWVGAFPRVPCSCAGFMESMGWAEHFFLNLGLMGLAVYGLRSKSEDLNQVEGQGTGNGE